MLRAALHDAPDASGTRAGEVIPEPAMRYCESPYFYRRRPTREVVVGNPARGGVIIVVGVMSGEHQGYSETSVESGLRRLVVVMTL